MPKLAHEPEGWREDHAAQRDRGIRKRTFRVIGTSKVAGKAQGETVELEFTEAAIDVLIQAGCIQEIAPDALELPYQDQAGPTTAEPIRRAARVRNPKGDNTNG